MDKKFYITYYAKKHAKFIKRLGTWTEGCKSWTSKDMKPCLKYFAIKANEYITATGGVKIRYEGGLN